MATANKTKLIAFYKKCTSKGYTNMADETQALKAKVIADDLGLPIWNIDKLFSDAKKEYEVAQKEYEHSLIEGKKIFVINNETGIFRREDGTVYSRGANNSESVDFFVTKSGSLGYDYHPAKTVYTGATVGGVHTGGFHEEKAYVTEKINRTGNGIIYANLGGNKIELKTIRIECDVAELFKRDAEFRTCVDSNNNFHIINCYSSSKTASVLADAALNGNMPFEARQSLMSKSLDAKRLPMQKCIAISDLLIRIMNNNCPPSEEEFYQKADALAAGNSVAELNKAIETFSLIKDYKDSEARIKAINERLPELVQFEKEQRIIKKEKEAEEFSRKMKIAKKVVLIAIPVIVALIIAYRVADVLIWKTNVYNSAVSMAEAGDYENAISSFERIGSFRDSEQLAREAKNKRDYNDALRLFNEKEYELAITRFEVLGSYSNSAEKVLEIRCAYARSLSEEDRYDQALEQVKLAGDYKDSAAVMEEIKLNQYVYSIREQLRDVTDEDGDATPYTKIAALNKAIKDIEAHTKGMQLNERNAKFYENIKKVQPYLGNWKCTRPKDFALTYYANSNLVVIEPINIYYNSFQLRMYGAKSAKSYNDRYYDDFELDDIKMTGANKLTIEGVRYGYGRVFVR